MKISESVAHEQLDRQRRSAIGQFLTPEPVADLMASLFEARWDEIELLDAGAGAGALTAALVRRVCAASEKPKRLAVTAYELDPALSEPLRATLSDCRRDCERAGIEFSSVVFNEDFVAAAAPMVRGDVFATQLPGFNAAIVNPPYHKIRSNTSTRLLLRSAGIETSNIYTGFVALIAKLLTKGGELVAITPRSFCNGPYFKPFRTEFLETMSLRRLHVFESRSAAFRDDDVLQENVIVHALKDETQPRHVVISSSSGEAGDHVTERQVDYRDIVSPDDPEQFVHLVVDDGQTRARLAMSRFSSTLDNLGVSVSTGRVVDFRAEQDLRQEPSADTMPLIYPCHFNGGYVNWPKSNSRKPNAIVCNERTADLLIPAGVYVLVKRFTAKEERRRVVACIYDPERNPAPLVAFENHLNYFHVQGQGLSMSLAKGLAAFLNSTVVDVYFRQFSGHTQVNATDLRMLNYPTKTDLERLGSKIDDPGLSQTNLDALVSEILF
ncbi:MAG: Eco57I restriction-modification methylase domain-containing protein [Nitrospirota bacterium]